MPTEPKHQKAVAIVKGFALLCVAVTSGFVIYMRIWETKILSSDGWCDRAIGATKETGGRSLEAIGACFTLLNAQLKSTAINSHIDSGVQALCLLVLIVIVVAEGKLSLTASKSGVSTSVGREELPERAQGAQDVAEAAENRAEEIAAETVPTAAPAPLPPIPPPPPRPPGTEIIE